MIVLDTHTLIWWVGGDRQLSDQARDIIERELDDEGQVAVSSISAWEIAMLVSKGRLALAMDVDEWVATVAEIDGVEFVPVTQSLAIQSVRLPGDFHPDPADQMIVALARHLSAPLVTADHKIRDYQHVKTIW